MRSALELVHLGKQLANDYVNKNSDMTESLTKVGEIMGLNKQELSRVAETANVEAYLQLIKKAEDKYLTFPLADVNKICMEKKAAYFEDDGLEYAPPSPKGKYSMGIEKLANAPTENLPKPASNQGILLKQASQLKSTIKYLNNSIDSATIEFHKLANEAFNMIKQEMLSGNISFADAGNIIKEAAYSIKDPIINDFMIRIAQAGIRDNLIEKVAHLKPVNKSSELFTKLAAMQEKFNYIDTSMHIVSDYVTQHNDFVAEHKLGNFEKVSGIGSAVWKIVKNPLVLGAGAVAGAYTLGKINSLNAGSQRALLNRATAADIIAAQSGGRV